jgi:uncharacterized repeat protein (TIGR03809 family)
MTHRADVARGRDTLARWCALAEQRLEHLTELFETGRWRRYHSELAFLENIKEAKIAVETWRDLSSREASFDHSALMSWLRRSGAASPRGQTLRDQVHWLQQRVEISDQPPPSEISVAAQTDRVTSDDAPSVSAIDHAPVPAPGIAAIQDRYPLLRNTL